MKKLLTMTGAAAFAIGAAVAGTNYTSSSYVQRGLVAQWDGIDNAGTGVHDSTTSIWKDLKGGFDLTLMGKGAWSTLGNSLVVNGPSAFHDGKVANYRTIEVVYKMTARTGRILFSGGETVGASAVQSPRVVVFDHAKELPANVRAYCDGKNNTPYAVLPFDPRRIRTISASYPDGETVSRLYAEGHEQSDGTHQNTWGVSMDRCVVGNRTTTGNGQDWLGEVYAIRLYDTVLTTEEIARNHSIDMARFAESRQYVQDGLVAQWDGIENAGLGIHNAAATVWKDLAGDLDLALTGNGGWNARGNAFVANGPSAVGEAAAPAYQTIEVVYRMTRSGGRMLLNSGDDARHVLFDANKVYLDAGYYREPTTPYASYTLNTNEICCISGVYDGDAVSSLYFDGDRKNDGLHNNYFSSSASLVLGGRLLEGYDSYPWHGEIYAIRLYSRRLSRAELVHNNRLDRMRFMSSAGYEGCDAMISQWDGSDNAGTGVHDANATVWRDIRSAYNLTLTANGGWTAVGNGLAVSGASAYYNGAGPAYRTFEVAYRETDSGGRFLFNSGNSGRQVALFNSNGTKAWFSGLGGAHQVVNWAYDANAVRTMTATYTNVSATAEFAYGDGARKSDGTVNDSWGTCESKIIVGDNKTGGYRPWYGEAYAIRLYNRELTDAEIAFNSALDKKRISLSPKTVTWGGGDGDFSTKANWVGGATPRYMDNAVISSGTAAVEEEVVGSMTLGAGVVLSLAVPADAGVVPLAVLGGISAENGAVLQLDAAAFGKKHPGESVTIVECKENSFAALETLAANPSFINTINVRRGRVSVSDGKRLVYTAPQKPGMAILIL